MLLSEVIELLSMSVEGARIVDLCSERASVSVEGPRIVLADMECLSRVELLDAVAQCVDSASIGVVPDLGLRIYLRPSILRDLHDRGLGVAQVFSGLGMGIVYRRGYNDEFARRAVEVWRESVAKGPMPISVNTAKTLYALTKFVTSWRRGRVVEVGSGLGFSTLFMAYACRETGCRLLSFEVREDRARYVESVLRELGLDECTEIVIADAKSFDLGSRDVVLAFIDGAKEEYHEYLLNLEKFLTKRAIVLAHNTLSHPHLVSKYIELVYSPRYRSVTVATDPAGLTLSIYLGTEGVNASSGAL